MSYPETIREKVQRQWLDRQKQEAQHCQCRSGSPDSCPKCTDMETGEKYADQDVAD